LKREEEYLSIKEEEKRARIEKKKELELGIL